MKTLSILRHAKSSWKDLGVPDHERPLNKRGRHDAPLMGKLLRDQNITPDLIISSTAIRAATTAKLVAKACKYKGEIIFDKSVYNTEPIDALNLLSRCSDRYYSIFIGRTQPYGGGVNRTAHRFTGNNNVNMCSCSSKNSN